ncbi:MAG: hypothetical protein V2B14_02165 [bacterium]
MIEQITNKDQILAIIIRNNYNKPGISFFTPDNFSQQLAYINYPQAKEIQPHVHNIITREVHNTQEVLFLKKGCLRVDFYDEEQNYLKSSILQAGDIILLACGGHGFEALEEIEMIEVKQGPYAGDKDKTRFQGVSKDKIILS